MNSLEPNNSASTEHTRDLTTRLLASAEDLRLQLKDQIPPKYRGWLSAEDVLQEVWEAAYRNLDSFQPNGHDSFRKWLRCIALNTLRNTLRHAGAAKRGNGRAPVRPASTLLDLFTADKNPEYTPRTNLSIKEVVDAVQTALPRLGRDTREAVTLFHFEGLSRAEVGVRMGITTQRAITLLEQGRDELRALLADRFLSNDDLLGIANQDTAVHGEPDVQSQRT